jgi:hypothetical protein
MFIIRVFVPKRPFQLSVMPGAYPRLEHLKMYPVYLSWMSISKPSWSDLSPSFYGLLLVQLRDVLDFSEVEDPHPDLDVGPVEELGDGDAEVVPEDFALPFANVLKLSKSSL